jgi:hypothetical protein
MKPYLLIVCFVVLVACRALAQTGINQHQKITHVVLTAPPNAHHFGEGYRAISLKDVEKESTDTIKVYEKISNYKIIDSTAMIYVGGLNPNQKLTVVLKGEAKQYFDAMLEIEFKGKDISGMSVMGIGKITRFENKPQIVVTNPNLFTVISD